MESSVPALALLVVFVCWQKSAPCLDAVRTPGISPSYAMQTVRLQLAGSSAIASQVIADWKAGCVDPTRPMFDYKSEVSRTLTWNKILVLSYALFLLTLLSTIAFWVKTFSLRLLGVMLSFSVIVIGALDFASTFLLQKMVDDGVFGSILPATTTTVSTLKFGLMAMVGIYVVVATSAALAPQSRRKSHNYGSSEKDGASSSVPTDAPHLPGAHGEAATLQQVREAELSHIRHHRHTGKPRHTLSENLVGLALSGGGIRAATTSLGTVQALSRLGILPFVDYLSTVSGGGYLGGCFSSLLSLNDARVSAPPGTTTASESLDAHLFRVNDRAAFGTEWQDFPFRDDQSQNQTIDVDAGGTPDDNARIIDDNTRASRAAQIIAHIRTHGNFLIARRGMLSRDTLRAIGSLVTGVVFQLASFLLVLLAATALYLTTIASSVANVADAFDRELPVHDTVSVAVQPIADTVKFITTESTTGVCTINAANCSTVTHADVQPSGATSWISFEQGRALSVVKQSIASSRNEDDALVRISIICALCIGAFGTLLSFFGLNLALALSSVKLVLASPLPGEGFEEAFDKAVLWLFALINLLFLALATLAWHRPTAHGADALVVLWLPLATVVGARVTSFIIAIVLPRIVSANQWNRRLRTLWNAYQASLTYGIWLAVVFLVLAPLMFALAGHQPGLSVSSLVALVVTRYLAPSRTSGKPSLTFLPVGIRNLFLGSSVFAVIFLCSLTFGALMIGKIESSHYWQWAVVTTGIVVLLGFLVDSNIMSVHYFYRDRLAETYLLSELPDTKRRMWTFRDSMELPLHRLHGDVLDKSTNKEQWRNTAPYHLITAAINLAGTRELTRKDRKSGHWLFSKLYCGSIHTNFRPTAIYRGGETKLSRAIAISGAAVSSGMGYMTFFAQSFATVLFNLRLGYWTENPRLASSQGSGASFVFWPGYLWREMAMRTNDRTKLVNLSDGGHTGDNCGVYPLLQRRCKVIIVGDAEEDKAMSFGSFTEVLRHAYVDDGINVDIDLSMLGKDPQTGLSKKHCAVGRIRYPDRPHQESYLIYLKNSLTGDESPPIVNYRSICPDFPHETTVDQFFNDAQFESYRALGEHVANAAFESWSHSGLFALAQRMHSPVPITRNTQATSTTP